MGVENVRENTTRSTATFDDANGWTASRMFDVVFTKDTPAIAMPLHAVIAPGIPENREQHPYNTDIRVIAKTSKYISAYLREVAVAYAWVQTLAGRGDDPLDEPVVWSWSFATTTEPVDRDAANNAITNSAGEPFDPPISAEFHDLVARVVRNEAAFYPLLAADYKGSVNSDGWLGYPPGTCKLQVLTGNQIFYGDDKFYWQVTYEIHIRYDAQNPLANGWLRRILDQGTRKKTGVDSGGFAEYENITENNGLSLSEPVQLNGSGGRLADSAPPVYLSFNLDPIRPFAALNLV